MAFSCVGIDTETSGLGSKAEIVEISAIEFDPATGELGKKFLKLYKAERGISPGATAVNGITDAMVEDCPLFEILGEEWFELQNFVAGRTLVGHNIIGFDLPKLGIETSKAYDTVVVCRRLFPGSRKLLKCCEHFGIEWDASKAHRAEYDVEQTIKVFVALQAPEVQAQLAVNDTAAAKALEEALEEIGDVHPIIRAVAEGTTDFWITTRGPAKFKKRGAPFKALYKEAGYPVEVFKWVPEDWGRDSGIPGIFHYEGKDVEKMGNIYLTCKTVEGENVEKFSRYWDDEGNTYTKAEVAQYLPSGGVPGVFTANIANIIAFEESY